MKAVVFDLGGVVVEWSNEVSYREMERLGIPAEDAKRSLRREIARVQTGVLPEVEWMRPLSAKYGVPAERLAELWRDTFLANWRFNEEALRVVREVRSSGLLSAALSNIEPSRVKPLRDAGIAELFDEVGFSSEMGVRKPDSSNPEEDDLEAYTLILGRLKVQPEDAAFVDDSPSCVLGAGRAGMTGILYENPAQLRSSLEKWRRGWDLNPCEHGSRT